MKNSIILFVALLLVSCEDNAKTHSPEAANQFEDLGRLHIPPDAAPEEPPDAYLIRQWDSAVDALVDAAPERVCENLYGRAPCEIEGLVGPCAIGEKICYLTHWGQCSPTAFPRQEVCNAVDDDCDGRLNESPSNLVEDPQIELLSRACYTGPPGTQKFGPCRPGIRLCTLLTRQTDAGVEEYYGFGECEGETPPGEEQCDSIDNDCDGLTDEGVLNVCSQCGPDPIEVCDGETDEDCDGLVDEGVRNICDLCGPDPIEQCDGLDNDCDDSVDEGLLNDCGECGPLPRELCDFVDNDCDGHVDEDFAEEVCACDHPDYVPQPEICNGADEDCDGFVDEGPNGGPLSMLCSTDILTNEVLTYENRADGPEYVAGDCRLGAAFCEQRRNADGELQYGYFECQQEIRPSVERCDNEDNDCDGSADEDFQQGRVAVMMIVDISGSMDDGELGAAFDATRNSVRRLFNDGIEDVCYMLAVVGNDDMPDPYLSYPGDNCVPGVEDPPIVPIEDMTNAVNTLRRQIQAGAVNQGGASENTLDALGKFFTDDRIDWDRDGINDNVLWNTSRPEAAIQGIEDQWEVDLSLYTHRIAIVIGDEPAQGSEFNNHAAASAMAHANGMAFIIGNRQNVNSYQPLIDFGAVHVEGLQGFRNNNVQQIIDVVTEAIEEAACINNRQGQQDASLFRRGNSSIYSYVANIYGHYSEKLQICL